MSCADYSTSTSRQRHTTMTPASHAEATAKYCATNRRRSPPPLTCYNDICLANLLNTRRHIDRKQRHSRRNSSTESSSDADNAQHHRRSPTRHQRAHHDGEGMLSMGRRVSRSERDYTRHNDYLVKIVTAMARYKHELANWTTHQTCY